MRDKILKTLGYDTVLELYSSEDVDSLFIDLEDAKDEIENIWSELETLVEEGMYSY